MRSGLNIVTMAFYKLKIYMVRAIAFAFIAVATEQSRLIIQLLLRGRKLRPAALCPSLFLEHSDLYREHASHM